MRIVTFGEMMLRLSPEGYNRLFQSERMVTSFGGSEANVAISLAHFGMDAAYVTKLPDNPVGQACLNSLRAFGIDTGHIARGGDRLGVYYLEKGAAPRSSLCIYDRAHSAIAEAQPADFDWDAIFEGADWFHFTGITPALGGRLVDICLDACKAAKAHGVKVSCDLNYRSKLWSRDAARAAMTKLCRYVDLCIYNEEEAKDVLGIDYAGTEPAGDDLSGEAYVSVAARMMEQYGFGMVATALRTPHAAYDIDLSGMLYDGRQAYVSGSYNIQLVDTVGGGDAFGAGLIYALMENYDKQSAIEFAVAASALKHTIEGDFNRVSVKEVRKIAGGSMSGRIER